MADFEVRVALGTSLRRWTDPVGPNGEPSRARPHPGRDQVFLVGKVGVLVIFQAVVDLVVAPPDSALGGRLFSAYLVEGFGPPLLSSAPGWSSVVHWQPQSAGHHVIGVRRPGGGAVLYPIDVEP